MCVSCFFFFKQKTAYEMRISDWSSDVCSSDLSVEVLAQVVADDPGDLVGVVEEGVEGAVLREPLHRGLLADLGDAREVVAGLADERGDLGVLSRWQAVLLHDCGRVVPLELRHALDVGVQQRHIVGDELDRSEEHTSELQSLMRISYAVFCLKKKK